jgi:hypothetical protein
VQGLTCFGVFFVLFTAFKCLGVLLSPVVLLKYIRIYLHMHVGNSKEPRGLKIGDCIVPLEGDAACNGRRVDIAWLDGYYLVGDWLCEERSGFCVRVPALRVALERLRRRVDVVRARLVY